MRRDKSERLDATPVLHYVGFQFDTKDAGNWRRKSRLSMSACRFRMTSNVLRTSCCGLRRLPSNDADQGGERALDASRIQSRRSALLAENLRKAKHLSPTNGPATLCDEHDLLLMPRLFAVLHFGGAVFLAVLTGIFFRVLGCATSHPGLVFWRVLPLPGRLWNALGNTQSGSRNCSQLC